MNSQKPIASLSLDLDNKWTYLKTHGDSGWEDFPSYLEIVVPRVLEFLAKRQLKITFFIVGQDAALERNHRALRAIATDGHEIGNHSFSHEPWLHLFDKQRIEKEIAGSEEQIAIVTGQCPRGFRGPGFTSSETTLEVLRQRGYLYDASTLPTFIGPLARMYYFMHSKLGREELERRQLLFGLFRDGLRPIKPYRWGGRDGLLEIPVTTMPILRFPIHFSYILYLCTFSSVLALSYLRMALALCRLRGVSPSFLLHPLDFLGRDDHVGLDFFPAMKLSRDRKLWLIAEAMKLYCGAFHVVTIKEHALYVAEGSRIGDLQPCASDPVPSPRSEL